VSFYITVQIVHQIKSNHLFSDNTDHRKTKKRQKQTDTSRQKDRQKKANYIYKVQANYINYTNTFNSSVTSVYKFDTKVMSVRQIGQPKANFISRIFTSRIFSVPNLLGLRAYLGQPISQSNQIA